MTSKKKMIISLGIGAVIGVAICVYVLTMFYTLHMRLSSKTIVVCIMHIPVMMLYAFGYAFGWKRCKGFMAKAAKVSADIAFFSILIYLITGKGIGKGLLIAMFVFSCAIGIVWIPGVVWGIRQLITEHKEMIQRT